MSDIAKTLEARGKRYGDFHDHAVIAQNLKARMKCATNWELLTHSQKEALEMIQHKVARILNGDAGYMDSWHDIAGYATLVEKELLKPSPNITPPRVRETFDDALAKARA